MLSRRAVLGATIAATLAPQPARAAGEDARLAQLLDASWDASLDDQPQWATSLGLDTGQRLRQRQQLTDASRGGRHDWFAGEARRLRALGRIDRTALSADGRIDLDAVKALWQAAAKGGAYEFGEGFDGINAAPFAPFAVTAATGPHQSVPRLLLLSHPVATVDDAEAWLSRLASYGQSLDDSSECLRIDSDRGICPCASIVAATTAALDDQLSTTAEAHPLAVGLGQAARLAGLPGSWQSRAAALITERVLPALARQRALVDTLRPGADAGIWQIPGGDAYYADALAFHTTPALPPGEMHRLAIEEIAAVDARLAPLLTRAGIPAGNTSARLQAFSALPGQHVADSAEGRATLLALLNADVAKVRGLLPRAFALLPAAPVEIVAIAPGREALTPGGYNHFPSPKTVEPGRFHANLANPGDVALFSLPALARHEALPGHQWAAATVAATRQLPAIRRYRPAFAHDEGWALYAGALVDALQGEAGDLPARIGTLSVQRMLAARAVVDTGIHHHRWPRERAAAWLAAITGAPQQRALRDVDRAAILPGQSSTWFAGWQQWTALRHTLEARDPNFDVRRFHLRLRHGSMMLQLLGNAGD